MHLKTYLKKYFISDLIVMTILAGLIYLPSKLFAGDTAQVDEPALAIPETGPIPGDRIGDLD